MKSNDIILGLDASSSSTGWAIFDKRGLAAYGIIQPNDKDLDWRDRLVKQGDKLREVIEQYHPNKIVMEDVPLKNGNSKVLVILGAVQGFIYGIASSYSIPVYFVLPSEWRSPLGLYDGKREGTKRKELKKKSIEKANELFGLNLMWVSPSSKKNQDDISDAILLTYSQIKPRRFGKSR
ncbi:MAG: crossover junction endodeoxyribonuclease RuvC [Prevotellaceae bacterium]|nr:crossover junction endodeoxyribonuclease RuvC [Prevotellaceae bacterium]